MNKKHRATYIRGQLYVPRVFIVRSKNDDGSPQICEHLRNDDVAKPGEGDTEFIVAYVPAIVFGTEEEKRS